MDPAVEPLDARLLVDLINEFSHATRLAASESELAYPEIYGNEIAHSTTLDLVRAADQLFEVFAAAPDPAEVVDQLNNIFGRSSMTLGVVTDGRSIARQHTIKSDAPAIAAAGALTLAEIVERQGVSRLGMCAALDCTDVFIDRSQRGNRSYCSTTCNTRTRVRRLRERERQ